MIFVWFYLSGLSNRIMRKLFSHWRLEPVYVTCWKFYQRIVKEDYLMIYLAMSRRKTLSPPDPMSYLRGLALRIWTLFLRREGSAVWTCGTLQWCSQDSLWPTGKRVPGSPKMTWKQLKERDCREWMLSAINPHDRHSWRSGARSAIHAASQLPGRGPTDVDVAPVPAH